MPSMELVVQEVPEICIWYYLGVIGDHTIELEVSRQPLQANQPVEHDVAKWNIKVVP